MRQVDVFGTVQGREDSRWSRSSNDEMVWIPGGSFRMGSDPSRPGDASGHAVTLEGFWIDRYPVTNEQFRAFVKATKYITTAERDRDDDRHFNVSSPMRYPGSLVFVNSHASINSPNSDDWWVYMRGADWRHPQGPHSSLDNLSRHPAVHISYLDALAFASWAGKELPTETQWEYAANGGWRGPIANVWRQAVPHRSSPERTSPVGAFRANGYGLHDIIGNVWEWTTQEYLAADADALSENRGLPRRMSVRDERFPYMILKGGSYLGPVAGVEYRHTAGRLPQRADVSTCDVGFRCVLPVYRRDRYRTATLECVN